MLTYQIESRPTETIAAIDGAITGEGVGSLNRLLNDLTNSKNIVLDLEKAAYFDSLGIRGWINFLRNLSEGRAIRLTNCSSEFMKQVAMMTSVRHGATIVSFVGNYICDDCDHEYPVSYETNLGLDKITEIHNAQACPNCGGDTELEAEAETYFRFLQDD